MINFKPDTRTFKEKLAVGNEKEEYLVDILNLSGVPARLNNVETVTDIDIELHSDNLFIDCKLVETPFYKSMDFFEIEPDKCLSVKERHVRAYDKTEKDTGNKCWIAFFINFKPYNVYKLVFIPNSYLVHLLDKGLAVTRNNTIYFDSSICRDMNEFLNYVKLNRKVSLDREKNK